MKMNRRKALIGIGSLAVGSGAALGSGAFTSVTANRDVTIEVTDDSDGLLGIAPGNNGTDYVSGDSDNDASTAVTISITSDELGSNAGGLNNQAIVRIDEILQLTNNAGQEITVESTGSSSGLTFDLDDSTGGDQSSVTLTNDGDTTQVDLEIDTSQLNDGETTSTLSLEVT